MEKSNGLSVANGLVELNGESTFCVAIANLSSKSISLDPKLVVGQLCCLGEYEVRVIDNIDEINTATDAVKVTGLKELNEQIPGVEINTDGLSDDQVSRVCQLLIEYKDLFNLLFFYLI